MSTDQVKREIRRFLMSDDNISLCLSGKWGIGKTHTWDTLLAEAFMEGSAKPPRYAYVSLFGLESLGDVRRSLFENTVEAASFKSAAPLEATIESVSARLKQLASRWRAGTGILRGVPIVADYSGLAEKAGFLEVRDQIVCFDDLERMSEGLDLKDVLGLISFLKEKKRCKVALLLNSEALRGQNIDDFNFQLEKVIDINLTFMPSAREITEIAIPDRSTTLAQMVAGHAEILEITNIRTIRKLLRMSERLEEILEGYDNRIIKQAIHSACLFGFALHQPIEAPSIDGILKSNDFSDLLSEPKERTPRELQDAERLRKYDFLSVDDFDLVIFENIRRGFYDEIAIRREADAMAGSLSLNDQDAAIRSAWDIFHDSFDDNADAFAAKLKQSLIENTAALSPENLSSAVAILKKLGHRESINEIIDAYINSRPDSKNFWSRDRVSSRFTISDPDVAAAFAAKAAEFTDSRTLHDAAISIIRDSSYHPETLDFIDSHTTDDFYAVIKAAKENDLRDLVKGLTYYKNVGNPNERMASISKKAVLALERIGQESEINRLRVQKFGVVIPQSET